MIQSDLWCNTDHWTLTGDSCIKPKSYGIFFRKTSGLSDFKWCQSQMGKLLQVLTTPTVKNVHLISELILTISTSQPIFSPISVAATISDISLSSPYFEKSCPGFHYFCNLFLSSLQIFFCRLSTTPHVDLRSGSVLFGWAKTSLEALLVHTVRKTGVHPRVSTLKWIIVLNKNVEICVGERCVYLFTTNHLECATGMISSSWLK